MAAAFPVSFEDIIRAGDIVHRHLAPTPLLFSPMLSEAVGHDVYIKWDNRHRTGSFKERGAIHFIGSMKSSERTKGLCAASAGNHALALSYYAQKSGIPCTIVMPKGAPLVKVQSTLGFGAHVILEGASFDDAYQRALSIARETGAIFVSAFDDPRIIAGQGTLGLELLAQMEDFDSVVVPIGGGGLISGVALAVKEHRPHVHIHGVRSAWTTTERALDPKSPRPGPKPTTIADGIAVKTYGKITEPIIAKKVDSESALSEQDIAHAVMRLLEWERSVVEGAGAAAVGALLAGQLKKGCRKTIAVVCGSNIDMNMLSRLIIRDQGERQRVVRLHTSVPDRPGSLHYLTGLFAEQGANILEVIHDRSFARVPGNVSITFLIEVRDLAHKESIKNMLTAQEIEFVEIED